jgi:outer membrane protein OmpA-like peptidoglycan-associated protein
MKSTHYDALDEGAGPWPALSDLLAASTMMFLVLFAVIAIPALRAKGRWAQINTSLNVIQSSIQRDSFQVRRFGDYLLVTIKSDAVFPLDGFKLGELRPEGQAQLKRLAGKLREKSLTNQIDQIQVVGHTSGEGSDEHNWRLSSQRAATVALFLIQESRLPACQVTALGRGRYYPLNPARARVDTTPNALDRRIEIEVRPRVIGDTAQARRRNDCVNRPGSGG